MMIDPVERAAARALLAEVGLGGALRVGLSIAVARLRGEPFGDLPPAEDEAERFCRGQAGPAILLYRALGRRHDPPRALEITRAAVIAGAHVFLRRSIGTLSAAEIESLDEAGRRRYVEQRGERFLNATIRWDEVAPERVRFTVLSCRFPTLCAAVGVPELAPVFCAGDASFFGGVEPNVTLERTQMIAEGDPCCDFTLRWRR